ncbi:PREDICTED: uncharacterized protein LOC104804081 [Tarenaya hassleriana]|uniref:uncharacterized protein LOC104804081 n=1 Tax=Tarenaya hassleriana TaxID=28532 RepID=UPI00053C5770|nr:PREDICTED: uncharacterized protein LOC104804081 [Tarenaya hassleriana]
MMLATGSCLSWRNFNLGPPCLPLASVKAVVSSGVWFNRSNTISPLSCSARTSVPDTAQIQSSTALNPWSEFAGNVSGEWDGFGAEFSSEGQPIELPESVVPEAYREWEVKVFDWQTQCPTLAQPLEPPTMVYKSIKLLPTVGCEADAATRHSIDERTIGGGGADSDNCFSASAFGYSDTGSYVAVWPLENDNDNNNNLLEVEHCLINPNDKESRVRIYQVVRLVETRMVLQGIKVFREQWDGPFRNGDQLGGCAIRDTGFASTPTTPASEVVGAWTGLHSAAAIDAFDSSCSIQQVRDKKGMESVRDERDIVLLPKGLWCSLKENSASETVSAVGWLYEQGRAVTSRCVFSCDSKLKEISIGKETAESNAR